jgi:sulfur-carrier protein
MIALLCLRRGLAPWSQERALSWDKAVLGCAPMQNTVKMLAFAGARDLIGDGETALALEAPCTAAELLAEVCRRYPALEPYRRSIRVAVNGVYAAPSDPVTYGDEVALIPPVAGG